MPGRAVRLDEVEGLGVDDGLDGLLERLAHDLADLFAVPPPGEGQHGLAHPGQLLLARPEVQIDDLGDQCTGDDPPVDQPAAVEGPAEGGDRRLGDDRLVQVEEGAPARSMPHEQLLHPTLGVGRHQDQHLVADGQSGVTSRDDEPVASDDGHDRRFTGDAEVGDGDAGRRRVVGQRDLDQVGIALSRTGGAGRGCRPTLPPRPGR